ncbi:uncharacterized protein LOC128182740 [Crassostrea angulata]|uniref:uncharacterized protein LOC128182740 n=1 Tax=Magallana angulata TaxID=2784310 RepID=UPI0022B16B61|nr:uncharacterized protein LOC128182740 [Crassostrea angulata]
MNYSTASNVIGLILLLSKGSKPVAKGKDWKTANEYCRSQNDSLPDIRDVQNNLSYIKEQGTTIWSSVKGQFTPWIAYRGCFYENLHSVCSLTGTNFTNSTCHHLENNSAGNCYFECKSNIYTNGGCANTANFFFGLQKLFCLCLCDDTIIQNISESSKCNLSCGTSINDGECGGIGYISMYETINITIPETHFGGFCLTCRQKSDPSDTQLYSRDCNENIAGYCVKQNGRISLPLMLSTFASYWNHCKEQRMYIVGDTSHTFCQKDNNVWTGLRKYKISNNNIDKDSCYIIEIHQETVNYKKRNCTENIFFLCKKDIDNYFVTSIENAKSTKNTKTPPFTREISRTTATISPTSMTTSISGALNPTIATSISPSPESEKNTAAVVGASIAGVVSLIFVAFLVLCLLKRRHTQCKQSSQQVKSAKVFHNTTYDDLVVTNQKQDVNYANVNLENDNQFERTVCNIDDVYVEKEEEYDHLHTSRQKIEATMPADDERYGTASYFEDNSYSTLGQDKNVNHDLDNEYSVNSITYSENQSSSVNSAEYDYCYQANQRKDW